MSQARRVRFCWDFLNKTFPVASKSSELFMSENVRLTQKHRLLQFVLSNLCLERRETDF